MRRLPLRTALAIAAVAVAIALLEGTGEWARALLQHEPVSWTWRVSRTLVVWLTMAAVTPVPIAMGARFPLVRGRIAARLPLHLGAAVAFTSLHLVLDIVFQGFDWTRGAAGFGRQLLFLLGTYVAVETVIYFGVAGAVMYVRARREAEARALAAESLRAELSEARLAALESQLAPHVLFNTLNAISTLALRGEGARVQHALDTLSALLRRVLAGGPPEVPLDEELAFVAEWMELQQLRFGDRLRFERAIADGAGRARVPRMLLQPLVENAVRHGLAGDGGTVRLGAWREGDALRLEVSDPGSGAAAPQHSHGVGLANARARLRALHGDAASLELARDPGGTTVRVRLPFRDGSAA